MADTTYIGGGVYVRLTRAQLEALRHVLRAHQGHDRNWQVYAVRPSEAERIIEAYRHELPAALRAQV